MIEVVLLDIGGVLVKLGGVAGLQRLVGEHLTADEIHQLWGASEAVLLHETGKIDAATFAERLVDELDLPVSGGAFLQEFAQWPEGLQPGAKEMIAAIPPRYRTSALSNISDIHWSRIGGELGLEGAFHAHYFSHELGCMKPDRKIYEVVIADLQRPPDEVLFIDDSPRNVGAARDAGINAHIARNSKEAHEVLVRCGIIL